MTKENKDVVKILNEQYGEDEWIGKRVRKGKLLVAFKSPGLSNWKKFAKVRSDYAMSAVAGSKGKPVNLFDAGRMLVAEALISDVPGVATKDEIKDLLDSKPGLLETFVDMISALCKDEESGLKAE